jgi:hypothetical protein
MAQELDPAYCAGVQSIVTVVVASREPLHLPSLTPRIES